METKHGAKYNNFDFVDQETAGVKIRAHEDDRISAIILRSPDYLGLTYKVAVDK